ncbi:probable pectate lyase P59 [Andrographis paniculata]|uniref:probable pectate lyase P59 n=1 Tax=Andrographis paniculata TaxID=175694 RepID=UPI0021E9AA47|nr:probable pectate lyase P59 [Andrographis paniculata]
MQRPSVIFAAVLVLAAASTINGNIAEFDDFWKMKAEESWNRTLQSYEPSPAKIVSHLNVHAQRALEEMKKESMGSNSTRRKLGKGYFGPCTVTNPIDRCWRCNPNWAENRFRLADCGMGFGYKAKGGKNGKFYVVTDSSDNDMVNPKPGTLRHAVIQKEPLWITFQHDMLIRLSQELIVQSDKTIDGRGVRVDIAYGAGITLQFVNNVIIHGLRIHDIVQGNGGMIRDATDHYGLRTQSDGDGISLFGAQNIWVDHVSMYKCYDGLIDVIMGSTGVTISNSHFTDHNEALLFGASDSYTNDEKMQVTVAFNHFGKRMIQRMPRCRFGYIHVVNNDYTHWNMYAIGGSKHPTIISQGNRYIAPPDNGYAKEVTKREYATEAEWSSWTWRSEGDIFLRGAYFRQSGDATYTSKHPEKYDLIQAASAELVGDMTKFAGALNCEVGKPC